MRIHAIAILSLTAALAAQENPKTIVDLAVEAGNFKTLVAAVKAADLVDTLSGKGPFTVLAPTDAAFAKLGKEAIADLLKPENKSKLTAILKFHVVSGQMPAAKIVGQKDLTTLLGQRLSVVVDKEKNSVAIGGASVVATDLHAGNGIVHVIDAVLLPKDEPAIAASIVAAAQQAGTFKTLLKAAAAAGLAETLAKDGPFTVFAPTDAAFAKLGKETIAELLLPESKDRLAAVLKYHVVAGRVLAADAMKLSKAKTLLGQDLTIAKKGDVLLVGGAKVIATDILAENGVVHVIDSVLLPQQ